MRRLLLTCFIGGTGGLIYCSRFGFEHYMLEPMPLSHPLEIHVSLGTCRLIFITATLAGTLYNGICGICAIVWGHVACFTCIEVPLCGSDVENKGSTLHAVSPCEHTNWEIKFVVKSRSTTTNVLCTTPRMKRIWKTWACSTFRTCIFVWRAHLCPASLLSRCNHTQNDEYGRHTIDHDLR